MTHNKSVSHGIGFNESVPHDPQIRIAFNKPRFEIHECHSLTAIIQHTVCSLRTLQNSLELKQKIEDCKKYINN